MVRWIPYVGPRRRDVLGGALALISMLALRGRGAGAATAGVTFGEPEPFDPAMLRERARALRGAV